MSLLRRGLVLLKSAIPGLRLVAAMLRACGKAAVELTPQVDGPLRQQLVADQADQTNIHLVPSAAAIPPGGTYRIYSGPGTTTRHATAPCCSCALEQRMQGDAGRGDPRADHRRRGVGTGEDPRLNVNGLEIVTGSGGTMYVVITADFFKSVYGSGLRDTLIFISSCQIFGVQATDIADALKGTGSVFVGWTESVYVTEATAAAVAMYTEMSDGGYTVTVAHDLIGVGLTLGTAGGPHPRPSLIVGGRSDGDGLRIREVVWVMHPETGGELMPADTVVIEGTVGDGEDDKVPYLLQVDGIKPEDASGVMVHIEIDGVEADPKALTDYNVNGDDQWIIEEELELERDVEEGEEVLIHAWVELHDGGESHHEVEPVVLTGQREWELTLNYSRTPLDLEGPGSPDTASGTFRLALADFQNPTTPHLVEYSVVEGTMTVDPSSQNRFCIVKADAITFAVTPNMTGFSKLVIDTSKSPMEYSLWIYVDGPSYQAEYSCRAGTGPDAPEGYQDPETKTRSVNLQVLVIDLEEHRVLSDALSGSGTWRVTTSAPNGAIRETTYTLTVVR